MRVQLRGLSGDPALNGQCGKVGGFEGERVFVRLDNTNRVVKVKTINVRKEGGNAAWTRGESEGLGGILGGVMDALGQGASRIASGEDSNQITVDQLRDLDVSPARCDSAKLAELSEALAAATAKVRDSASVQTTRRWRRSGAERHRAARRRFPRKKRGARSRTRASRSVWCA